MNLQLFIDFCLICQQKIHIIVDFFDQRYIQIENFKVICKVYRPYLRLQYELMFYAICFAILLALK